MRVTISISSYNQSQFLREAIESALDQTISCEVIVVDDGSTDGSLEFAKSYEPELRVISQVNKGLASTRNTGLMNSHGDYILFLDSDDSLQSNCIEELMKLCDQADIIAPSIHCFGLTEQDTILMETPKLEDFKAGNRVAYCALFKRQDLLDVGGYSPRMVEGYEDLHLTINLLTKGKTIKTISQPLFNYRTKEQSMWKESLKYHDKLMAQIYKDFPQAKP